MAERMAVVQCGFGGYAEIYCGTTAEVAPGGEEVFAFRTRIEAAGWRCIGGRWRCPAHSGVRNA